jgi:hypothetical protein
MKVTFDIPDDLYRSVEATCAQDGLTLDAAAVEAFRAWLDRDAEAARQAATRASDPITGAGLSRRQMAKQWLDNSR